MGKYFSVILLILFWILSFVNNSGWAEVVKLPERSSQLIIVISIILFLFKRRKDLCKNQLLINIGLIITVILIPFFISNEWEGAEYYQAFLVTYIISYCKISKWVITRSCLVIGLMGLILLLIYLKGSILSGWNDNAISMTGLFSFMFFSIFLISISSKRNFIYWNIVTLFYVWLLFQTDCRSGSLFAIIAVVAIFYRKRAKQLLERKHFNTMILLFPLILAFVVIGIASTSWYVKMDWWSITTFKKGIFDGRDILWNSAFEELIQSGFLGTGKFTMNYHNCSVAAICVFGVLGYIFWYKFFSIRLNLFKRYLYDKVVLASSIMFLLIFLQQAFDLGMISPTPNYIPYMILGVGMGRIYQISYFNRT